MENWAGFLAEQGDTGDASDAKKAEQPAEQSSAEIKILFNLSGDLQAIQYGRDFFVAGPFDPVQYNGFLGQPLYSVAGKGIGWYVSGSLHFHKITSTGPSGLPKKITINYDSNNEQHVKFQNKKSPTPKEDHASDEARKNIQNRKKPAAEPEQPAAEPKQPAAEPEQPAAAAKSEGEDGASENEGANTTDDVFEKVKSGDWDDGESGKSFPNANEEVVKLIHKLQSIVGATKDGVFGSETARKIRQSYYGK